MVEAWVSHIHNIFTFSRRGMRLRRRKYTLDTAGLHSKIFRKFTFTKQYKKLISEIVL
jgi:hypothetical protein